MSDDLRQRYLAALYDARDGWKSELAAVEAAVRVHRQWRDEIRDQIGTEGEDVQVWVDRAAVWVRTATEQRERAEVAERRLAELEAGLPEWRCPNCRHVTRARMADHGATERRLVHAEYEYDDTQRYEHLAAADPEEDSRG